MTDEEKIQVNYRLPRSFKDRLYQAAGKRGIPVTSYIIDRLTDHIDADLLDIHERLDKRCEHA